MKKVIFFVLVAVFVLSLGFFSVSASDPLTYRGDFFEITPSDFDESLLYGFDDYYVYGEQSPYVVYNFRGYEALQPITFYDFSDYNELLDTEVIRFSVGDLTYYYSSYGVFYDQDMITFNMPTFYIEYLDDAFYQADDAGGKFWTSVLDYDSVVGSQPVDPPDPPPGTDVFLSAFFQDGRVYAQIIPDSFASDWFDFEWSYVVNGVDQGYDGHGFGGSFAPWRRDVFIRVRAVNSSGEYLYSPVIYIEPVSAPDIPAFQFSFSLRYGATHYFEESSYITYELVDWLPGDYYLEFSPDGNTWTFLNYYDTSDDSGRVFIVIYDSDFGDALGGYFRVTGRVVVDSKNYDYTAYTGYVACPFPVSGDIDTYLPLFKSAAASSPVALFLPRAVAYITFIAALAFVVRRF